jgi:colanic acid/amylovoran biosynthesis protein
MEFVAPREILIINVHSTMNAGDTALLWLNMQQLAKAFPSATFTALVNYPRESYYTQLTNLRVMSSAFDLIEAGSERAGLKKILRLVGGCVQLLVSKLLPLKWLQNSSSPWLRMAYAYRAADVVAAVSGAQMVSLGKYSWPLIVSSVPVFITNYFHKPLYVMPQSIGPLRWQWEQVLVKQAYSAARLVVLRDTISINLAKNIGLPPKKVKFAFDPGFALPVVSAARAIEIMSPYGYLPGDPAIGITVIAQLSKTYDPASLAHYYQTLARVLARFSATYDIKIFVFDQVRGPTTREDDRIAAESLLEIVHENNRKVTHIKCNLTPMELKACYGLMGLFIASRLHSGIFAMSGGVPTIFIGYNPKTKGFLDAVGMSQLLLNLDGIDESRLYDLMCQSWENRQALAEQTRLIVEKCSQDFDRVSQWIYEDYFIAHQS